MKTMTKEEFLRLVEELTQQQYDDPEPITEQEMEWIPADPPAKDRIKLPSETGVIDLTKYKKDKIKDAIYKCSSLKVGHFTIKVTKYHGYPSPKSPGGDLKVDLSFWHEVYKTPSGAPCKMTYRLDVTKDSRFSNRDWLSYCKNSWSAREVPIDTAVEIIRWFQGIIRMIAFL